MFIKLLKDEESIDGICMSVLIGLTFTLLGYSFWSVNHIEQIPLIYRQMNSEYLRNDFFVNGASSFGPRYFYSIFLAGLSKIAPFPLVAFLLTASANILISIVSFISSRSLFKGSLLSGLLSSGLVFFASGFDLGQAAKLGQNGILPGLLSTPFSLIALWYGMNSKPIQASLFCVISLFFQPSIGGLTGVLVIGTFLFKILIDWVTRISHHDIIIRQIGALFLSVLIIGVPILLFLLLQGNGNIPGSQYVDIVARFRHPHHSLPSTFPRDSFIEGVLLIIALWVFWGWRVKLNGEIDYQGWFIAISSGIILLLCIAGYVFVEIIPVKYLASAQVFRILFIINWFIILLLSGVIAQYLFGNNEILGINLLISSISPIAIGIVATIRFFLYDLVRRIHRLLFMQVFFSDGILILIVIFIFAFWEPISLKNTILILLTYIMILVYKTSPRRAYYSVLFVMFLVLSIFSLVSMYFDFPGRFEKLKPMFSSIPIENDIITLANSAKESTPVYSVFLAPPDLGEFRILANRALVVDFRAFPFQENEILEWKNRVTNIYGETDAIGFIAADIMDKKYHNLTDRIIKELATNYGFQYAILYSDTITSFPIIYENSTYKLVAVP